MVLAQKQTWRPVEQNRHPRYESTQLIIWFLTMEPKTCWRKHSFINKWHWGNWISVGRKLKLDPSLSSCTNINSKCIKDLNIRPETWKLLPQERIGTTLEHAAIGNNFLNRTPIAQQSEERIDRWVYVKPKRFCTAEETATTEETVHRMGENLCQLYIWQGINNQNLYRAQKTKLSKNKWPNEEMGKWTEQTSFKGRSPINTWRNA
jgi:hypothetical protein